MNLNNGSRGFSLVEMIIVIAITAILVGVLAPMFIKYVESSRESVDIQNMDAAFQLASAMYAEEHETVGTYYYYFEGDEIGKVAPAGGYGKGTAMDQQHKYDNACCSEGEYDSSQDYNGRYIMIIFPEPDGEMKVHVHWSD